MTLPASGAITYNDVNIEMGRGSGATIDMSFIFNNTKTGQQSYALSNYYSKAYFQKNNDGNCNNGNCNCSENCFYDFPQNCVNCSNCTNVNCLNCDGQPFIQNNCNCAAGQFNCSPTVTFQSNCNCNCACFPADAMVRMADGTYRRISEIIIGDKVDGGYGHVNNVIAYHEVALGIQPLYIINGRHRTTREHRHWTSDGWAAIDTEAAAPEYVHEITIDNNGTKEKRKNIKLKHSKVKNLIVGMSLITNNGPELIESVVVDYNQDPDQLVYTLVCDNTHAHIVNGVVVSAWARDDDFDYTTWKSRTTI